MPLKKITRLLERAMQFVSRKRHQGRAIHQIILVDLPVRMLARFWRGLAAFANESLANRFLNIRRFQEFQLAHGDKLENHFYIIVMPNTLHFLIPCLKLIPKTVSVFLILNGTKKWEAIYLRNHFGDYPIFELKTIPRSSLSHGIVLNLLIDHNHSNFGIIDHDLYIFNPAIFGNLGFEGEECAIGAFKLVNQKAKLEFPTTHFLFFNLRVLKSLRKQYRIGAQAYPKIPRHLHQALAGLNLGYHNFLKDYHDYFDTLTLLFAMALCEKFSFGFLPIAPDDVYHIGATSGNEASTALGNYIGLRFLKTFGTDTIAQNSGSLYDQVAGSKELGKELRRNPQLAQSIASVELAIARIVERTQI